jgi:hypothetical protein
LMASEYPFRKIVGVELVGSLHHIANKNIATFQAQKASANPDRSDSPQVSIESICTDARNFIFPESPLVVFLFNPLPESGLRQLASNLEDSYSRSPRAIWIVYHNPVLEHVLAESHMIVKTAGRQEHSIFEFRRIE